MMKKILLIIFLICSIQLSYATPCDSVHAANGYGTYACAGRGHVNWYIYADAGEPMYAIMTAHCTGGSIKYIELTLGSDVIYTSPRINEGKTHSHFTSLIGVGCGREMRSWYTWGYEPYAWIFTITISPYQFETYHIFGDTCGMGVELFIKLVNGSYSLIETEEDSSYSFSIWNNSEYKLVFDDGYEYEFICTGSDIEYDYGCTYIYGYTCNINWVKLWRNDAGSWTYVDMESQPNHGLNTYALQIDPGYDYKVNFSDGHEHEFTCSGSDIEYDWDRCVWAYPPSPWQPPEIIPWYLGYDNNIVFMRDSHGNFIENAQIAVYNKNTGNYTQKWTNTPDPYILLAANNDSNDDVIVMCRTFDGIFTLETVDPAFGTDENVTWTNWTIPIMYNLKIHPIDQSNMPLHHVFVSMYEYAPFDPLAFFGYDTYWGCIPVTNCSGFSRCDIVAEKEGYRDYNVTGLNWTTKSALIKDYKQDIVLARES